MLSTFNKYIFLLSSVFLPITTVECTFYQINTTDGCPFSFDTGNYGLVYMKPGFCRKLLPDNGNVSETPESGPSPFTLKLYYTDEKDNFRLHITSAEKIPMYEIWVTTSRVTADGKFKYPVGVFLPEYNYELYCCDWTKIKTVARYSSGADSRASMLPFLSANIRWSPMRFSGRFVFVANILITASKWYGGVTSAVYRMPPYMPDFLNQDSEEMRKSLHFWQQPEIGETKRSHNSKLI